MSMMNEIVSLTQVAELENKLALAERQGEEKSQRIDQLERERSILIQVKRKGEKSQRIDQ